MRERGVSERERRQHRAAHREEKRRLGGKENIWTQQHIVAVTLQKNEKATRNLHEEKLSRLLKRVSLDAANTQSATRKLRAINSEDFLRHVICAKAAISSACRLPIIAKAKVAACGFVALCRVWFSTSTRMRVTWCGTCGLNDWCKLQVDRLKYRFVKCLWCMVWGRVLCALCVYVLCMYCVCVVYVYVFER